MNVRMINNNLIFGIQVTAFLGGGIHLHLHIFDQRRLTD